MPDDLIFWISAHITPFEPEVRRRLRRSAFGRMNEDDAIQEAYCRLARGTDLSAIRDPRAYFFVVVKNVLAEQIRRERLVRIDLVAEIDSLFVLGDEPSAERICSGRERLLQVKTLIEQLPDRCRQIFTLRRIEGLSQRETAQRLGVSENIVEKQIAFGLRAILSRLAEADGEDVPLPKRPAQRERQGNRRAD